MDPNFLFPSCLSPQTQYILSGVWHIQYINIWCILYINEPKQSLPYLMRKFFFGFFLILAWRDFFASNIFLHFFLELEKMNCFRERMFFVLYLTAIFLVLTDDLRLCGKC